MLCDGSNGDERCCSCRNREDCGINQDTVYLAGANGKEKSELSIRI